MFDGLTGRLAQYGMGEGGGYQRTGMRHNYIQGRGHDNSI